MRFRTPALVLAWAGLLFSQIIVNPGAPTNNPFQTNVSTNYLYFNKLHWAGGWAPGTAYNSQDVVSYSGGTYVSLAALNTGNTPSSSPTWWVQWPGSGTAPGALNLITAGGVPDGTLGNNSSGTDNSSAIQGALNMVAITGAQLFVPCGTFRHSTPLTSYALNGVAIVGASENCSFWYYSGSATQAQLSISPVAPSSPLANPNAAGWGSTIENITLASNGNALDGIDMYSFSSIYTRNTQIVGPATTCYHLLGVQYGVMDGPSCNRYGNTYDAGWTTPPQTANGIVVDGWPGAVTTGLMTINSPTIIYLSGIAIWIHYGNNIHVTAAQLSDNPVNVQVDSTAWENTFENSLFEGAGQAGNVTVTGVFTEFINDAFSGTTFSIGGQANHLKGGLYNGPGTLQITSSARGTRIEGINANYGGANISDNAPDTYWSDIENASGTGKIINFPVYAQTLPTVGNFIGGTQSAQGTYMGTWALTASPMGISPGPIDLSASGTAWTAVVNGTVIVGGVSGFQPILPNYIVNSTYPTITIGSTGATITFSLTNGNRLTAVAGGTYTTNIVFAGTVVLTPGVVQPTNQVTWQQEIGSSPFIITQPASFSYYLNTCSNPLIITLPNPTTIISSNSPIATPVYTFRNYACAGAIQVTFPTGIYGDLAAVQSSSGGYITNASSPANDDEIVCRIGDTAHYLCTALQGTHWVAH